MKLENLIHVKKKKKKLQLNGCSREDESLLNVFKISPSCDSTCVIYLLYLVLLRYV